MPAMFLKSRQRLTLQAALASALLLSWSPASQAASSFEHLYRDKGSSYVLVFAFPSAAYLDWSNPSDLARTSVQSALSQRLLSQPSTIGHAQFAWSCRQPDGTLVTSGASGQSGEHNGQSLKALLGGWGMSILELVYTDGTLEGQREVEARVRKGAKSNQFSWAGFEVPLENCVQLAQFVNDYKKSGAYNYYGFPVDPLKQEGGGCTSYANAALEISGLPLPFRPDWVRDYLIPLEQMGRSDTPPPHSTIVPQAQIPERPLDVSLGSFLFGSLQWAERPEQAVHFKYYDPELFYESFLHIENAYRRERKMPLMRQATRTSSLDPFQTRIQASSQTWVRQLWEQKVPMRLEQIAGYSGLMLDLRAVTPPATQP